ncbi:MAG: ABC transporter substrate-binding protein [Cruoricaptor ignavus]|nr:ABC transporter substrate-binding protein [Cruoricaptor ignavus]
MLRILFLCSLLLVVGCQKKELKENNDQQNKTAINVEDFLGNKIHLETPAKRVAVMFNPMLDAMYMLDATEQIIAVPADTYTDSHVYNYLSKIDERVKNKSLPTPGISGNLNVESILVLQPDLVIAYNISEGVVKNLNAMKIPVYQAYSETYDDLQKEISDLGLLLGKEEKSRELLDFTIEKFKQIEEQSKNVTQKSAYFAWANGRIFSTTGTTSMMNQCMVFAGVRNVCTTPIDQPNINPETFVSWNPDMVIMWNDSPNLFYQHKQLGAVNAVKNKQIYNLMPMFYYNPHTLKSLLTTIKIQNWAYEFSTEEDIMNETAEILKILYGEKNGEILFSELQNELKTP